MMEKRPQRGLPRPGYPSLAEIDEGRRRLLTRLASVLALPLASSRERPPPPPEKGKKKPDARRRPPPRKRPPRPPIVDDPGYVLLPDAAIDELDP